MEKKILFVLGTSRSGSTLLDLMLGNHQDGEGFSLGQIHVVFRPYRPHHRLRGRDCFCEVPNCNFYRKLTESGEASLYRHLFDQKPNVRFLVDSSKHPLWFKDQREYNKGEDFELQPVLIYKTPVEFAYSLEKRGQFNQWRRHWVGQHKLYFSILNNFISVKYKDLAQQPGNTLQRLSEELGIKYFSGKSKFWNNLHRHFLFGSHTVMKSREHVYYQEQFEEKKLRKVKQKIDLDQEIQDIVRVLEAHSIDTEENDHQAMAERKEQLAKFPLGKRLTRRVTSTRYYWINRGFQLTRKTLKKLIY